MKAAYDMDELGRPDGSVDPALARRIRHGYYASVSYLDAQVGKLLDELDRLGLTETTLVVFWSDHGFHLGERGHWAKRTLYEIDVRAPLMIAGPGVARGATADGIVEFVDFFPTLCDVAALPAPAYLEGTSFRAQLTDPTAPGKTVARFRAPRPDGVMGRGWRTPDGAYLTWTRLEPDGSERLLAEEVYLDGSDPEQARQVHGTPEGNAWLAANRPKFNAP
jgi:arylsulfatase A-like enzyme